MSMMLEGPIPLPPLREDLKLLSGTEARNGVLNWLIYDPVRNRYFNLYYSGFKMLSFWSQAKDSDQLEAMLKENTMIEVSQELVKEMIQFLYVNNLLEVKSREYAKGLIEQLQASKQNIWKKIVHHYLFFRIPLVRPDRILNVIYPAIKWMFNAWFFWLVIFCAVVGLLLTLRQWDTFLSTFLHFFTWQGLLFYGITLVCTKIVHELGHALVAKRYGCRISTMGIAFMVMFPLLYTDVTDGWRLKRHRQRLNISLAGMGAELVLASFALFLWNFMEDGPVRSAAFFVATTSWIITIVVNTNPFLRFDGYYILSDMTGLHNLQPRAFAFTRWWMREKLFRFRDSPPEIFQAKTQIFLVLYSFATWIYRLILFLGIALLVYYLFFKVLGIILFLVEIHWFILLPILKEIANWWKRREDMRLNINTILTFSFLIIAIGAFVIPWRSTITLPAHLEAEKTVLIFPPTAAQITGVFIKDEQQVTADQKLFQLESLSVDHRLSQLANDIQLVKLQISRTGANLEENRKKSLLLQYGRELQTQYRGNLELKNQLDVTTPITGRIVDFPEFIKPGTWVEKDKPLARVVYDGDGKIQAYSDEASLVRIEVGASAVFYPQEWERKPFKAIVTEIEQSNLKVLPKPFHGSVYGGDIPVRVGSEQELIPEKALYRVTLKLEDQSILQDTTRVLVGNVDIEGEKIAIITRLSKMVLAVLIRESGF